MGERAVKALIEGRSQRVVGIRNNVIEDLDIDEALSVEKADITDIYELAKTLSF
jgi:6-phosphofructokinase 1